MQWHWQCQKPQISLFEHYKKTYFNTISKYTVLALSQRDYFCSFLHQIHVFCYDFQSPLKYKASTLFTENCSSMLQQGGIPLSNHHIIKMVFHLYFTLNTDYKVICKHQAILFLLKQKQNPKINPRGLHKKGWDVKYLMMITKKSVGLSIWLNREGKMTLWTYNLLGVVSTAIIPCLNPMATVHLRFTDCNYSFNTVTVANKSHGVLD